MSTLTQQCEAALEADRYVSSGAHHPDHDDLSVAADPFPQRPRLALPNGRTFATHYRALWQWWTEVAQAHLREAERALEAHAEPTASEYAADCPTRSRQASRYAWQVSPAGVTGRHHH
ncbi:hypothetical protein ACFWDR_09460 [Micrococcus luteus]|uniref:Uncharacterized protein n=2 Tax=Micrococcus sp. V7 TaxID=404582 RepID=U5NWG6_9MICC|nr:hypothetical protein LMV7_p01100 [Micrococcus sp. V7]